MFKFIPGKRYLMPVQFGPRPDNLELSGIPANLREFPKRRTAFVHFRTHADQLQEILPPGFTVHGEPTISFEFSHHTEVPHLGGRGYGVFGVNYPARYQNGVNDVVGMFRSVTWENLPDAIIAGREDLGCHKLYCDFGEPKIKPSGYTYQAGLYGRRFFEMALTDLKEVTDLTAQIDQPFTGAPTIGSDVNEGLLFYKYIPRINTPGVADVEHAVLMPSSQADVTIERYYEGSGSASFKKVRWHDLPTYHHVVDRLAGLDLIECIRSSLSFSKGAMALTKMRAL